MERREGTGPVMEVNVLPCHLLNTSCGGTIGCQSLERGYFPCKPPPQELHRALTRQPLPDRQTHDMWLLGKLYFSFPSVLPKLLQKTCSTNALSDSCWLAWWKTVTMPSEYD